MSYNATPALATAQPTDVDIEAAARRLSSTWSASAPQARSGQIIQRLGGGRTRVVTLEIKRRRRP